MDITITFVRYDFLILCSIDRGLINCDNFIGVFALYKWHEFIGCNLVEVDIANYFH